VKIVVAGGTGDLGNRIVKALLAKNIDVVVIARISTDLQKCTDLEKLGAKVSRIDMTSTSEIAKACEGAACVVSALSGLRDVIVDAQRVLLDGALLAGVSRFIPSDYSLDYLKLKPEENRNLSFRKEFQSYLNQKPIKSTTIFNGAFMDMLVAEMPMILVKQKRIFYWGNKDQKMDFTTMNDVAEFTANVALDENPPRFLRIAGSEISPDEMIQVVSNVYGQKFKALRPGGLGLFDFMIKLTKFFSPGTSEIYPPWQGMQYMRNMLDGKGKLRPLDNKRYNIQWTTVEQFLTKHLKSVRN
jgi:nucleoside-diphosphate-sugar epimerase